MEILKPGRLFWALSMAALLATGCGDDDDDDGGKSVGPSGDGTVITAENASEVQAVVFTNIGNVAAKGPGTHNGAVSGKVKIELGGLGKAAQIDVGNLGGDFDVGTLQFNYSMDFDNYSDDGELWYNGIVSYEVSGTNFNYVFDVTVSGAYSGKVQGQVSLQNGVYSGSWDLGNGQVYSF